MLLGALAAGNRRAALAANFPRCYRTSVESERKSTADGPSPDKAAMGADPPEDARVKLADLDADDSEQEVMEHTRLPAAPTAVVVGETPVTENTAHARSDLEDGNGVGETQSVATVGETQSVATVGETQSVATVNDERSGPAVTATNSNAPRDRLVLDSTAPPSSAAQLSGRGQQPEIRPMLNSPRDPLDEMPALRRSAPEAPPATHFQRTGHPVRDRLLAKAAEANHPQSGESAASTVGATSPFSALNGIEEELEQLAAPRSKMLSEPIRVGRAVLSPTTTLVGVTVIGLAGLVSLFLLLTQFAPQEPGEPGMQSTLTSQAPATGARLSTPPSISTLTPATPPMRDKMEGPWRIGSAATGQRLIRGTIGKNPFLLAIQEAGLDKSQAYRVYGALKEHKNLDRCRPKDEFIALINRADSRVLAFEYVVSREEVYQAKENDDGKLIGKQLDLHVDKRQVQGSLLMASNFSQAATAAGLQPSIGTAVNRALEGHTSVSQFRAGDRLRIVAQEVTVLGEFYRYAGIEALEYLPVDGSPLRVYYHPTKKRYYDAKGRSPGEGGWRRPVRGAPITSKYNPQRLHPILKKRMPHNGTDFGAPTGTPVYAASYGKVTKRGNYGANGNFIAIEHPNGYETGYSHLSRFEPGLNVGDQVKRAQPIGYVGSTGRSTGPHLHFSAKKDGVFIDPESLNLDALTVLPSNQRAAFSEIREKYDALLEAVPLPPPTTPTETTLVAAKDTPPAEQLPATVQALPPPTVEATPAPPVPASPDPVAREVVAGGAFYLTDKELLQAQPAVDDGEVEE